MSALRRCGRVEAANRRSKYGNDLTFTNVIDRSDPTFNQLLGINNGGVISGYFGSGAAGHPNQGYITTTTNLKAFTPENFPGSVQTQVTGLNNNGVTVGFYSGTNNGPPNDANYGFWTNNPHVFTSVQDPFTPPATKALPTNQLLGINNSGTAVGFFVSANGNSHGYTFNTNTAKFSAPINAPGAVSTTTAAIDNAGDLAGFFTDAGGARTASWTWAEPSPRSTFPGRPLLRYSGLITTDRWSAIQ